MELASHRLQQAHAEAMRVLRQPAPPRDNGADTARRMRQVWSDADAALRLGAQSFGQERSDLRT